MKKKLVALGLIFFGLASLLPLCLSAQSLWLDQSSTGSLSFEALHPTFAKEETANFASSAFFLSSRLPLSERLSLTAELPFSYYTSDAGGRRAVLGNPYFGMEFRRPGDAVYGEVGLRLPLHAGTYGLTSGLASDTDRWEAFFGEVLSVNGQLNYVQAVAPDLSVRLRGGTTFWIYTGEQLGGDMDWFFGYGAQLWYDAGRVRLGGGLTGRALVTPMIVPLRQRVAVGDRLTHQAGLSVIGELRRAQPGLHVSVPLDEDGLGALADYVIGLSLTVPMR